MYSFSLKSFLLAIKDIEHLGCRPKVVLSVGPLDNLMLCNILRLQCTFPYSIRGNKQSIACMEPNISCTDSFLKHCSQNVQMDGSYTLKNAKSLLWIYSIGYGYARLLYCKMWQSVSCYYLYIGKSTTLLYLKLQDYSILTISINIAVIFYYLF